MCRDVLLHFIDTDDQNWKEILERTFSIKVKLCFSYSSALFDIVNNS